MKHIELLHLCNIINLDIFDKHINSNISNTPLAKFLYPNNDLQLKDDSDRNCFDKYYYSKTGSILSSRFEIHSIWNYNNLYHVNPELETSGFFCVVFKKIDTNELVIVFRSTDAELDDVMTDLDIGLWHRISLQQICAYKVLDRLHSDIKNASNTFLIGHSLGGALAQFAYIFQPNAYCVTFNNLGVGPSFIFDNPKDFCSILPSTLVDPFIHRQLPDYLIDTSLTGVDLLSDIRNNLIKLLYNNNPYGQIKTEFGGLKVSFMVGQIASRANLPTKDNLKQIPISEFSNLYKDLVEICRILIKKDMSNIDIHRSHSYILSKDWVPCINEQLGYCIQLDINPSIGYINYKYSGSYLALKKLGFKYHGLNLFTPYLNTDGDFIS